MKCKQTRGGSLREVGRTVGSTIISLVVCLLWGVDAGIRDVHGSRDETRRRGGQMDREAKLAMEDEDRGSQVYPVSW